MAETNENKTFDFATAVKYVLDGKKVRAVTWCRDHYLFFNRFGFLEVFRFSHPHCLPSLYIHELEGEWELYNG